MSLWPSALGARPQHFQCDQYIERDGAEGTYICGKSQRDSASKGTEGCMQQWQYLLEDCTLSSL